MIICRGTNDTNGQLFTSLFRDKLSLQGARIAARSSSCHIAPSAGVDKAWTFLSLISDTVGTSLDSFLPSIWPTSQPFSKLRSPQCLHAGQEGSWYIDCHHLSTFLCMINSWCYKNWIKSNRWRRCFLFCNMFPLDTPVCTRPCLYCSALLLF